MRNLSELHTKEVLKNSFKKVIVELTVTDKGTAEIKNYISLQLTKPKIAENQPYLVLKKSIFNKIIGDSPFELEFASYLENRFSDVISYAKNTTGEGGVNFKIEYQAEDGNIREYYSDFFIKTSFDTFYIVETKGREDLDDIRKIKRLVTWCNDINRVQNQYTYDPVYIKQEEWEKKLSDIKTFKDVLLLFSIKNADRKIPRAEAMEIIKRGVDVSSFGDPVEWQKEIRKDRKID